MNSISSPYRRVLVILLWVLVICLTAHALHDLQPGHMDFHGAASRFCNMVIHSGALVGLVPAISILALIIGLILFQQLTEHSGALSVPIPPPIYS
jgi:hypothetical protein